MDQWHTFRVSDQLIAQVQDRTFVDDAGRFISGHATFDGSEAYATVTVRYPGMWERLRFCWTIIRARNEVVVR